MEISGITQLDLMIANYEYSHFLDEGLCDLQKFAFAKRKKTTGRI